MNERADWSAAYLVSGADELDREFDVRMSESGTLVYRVAYSVLRNHSDAEDVAQEAFLRAHRRFTALRDRDRFRAWLVRITWRLALDWKRGRRRRDRREEVVARLARPVPNAEDDLLESDRARRLWAAIDALPDKYRLVIVLGAIEGHGVGDVAALLGVPAGTVKSRLFEARRRLQELLR
jgi:RNA polymerase sigma-70 factor (ECF subfamily)